MFGKQSYMLKEMMTFYQENKMLNTGIKLLRRGLSTLTFARAVKGGPANAGRWFFNVLLYKNVLRKFFWRG